MMDVFFTSATHRRWHFLQIGVTFFTPRQRHWEKKGDFVP
jgi:hypothetical protein